MEEFVIRIQKDRILNRTGIWFDGEGINCKTEEQARLIADLIEDTTPMLAYTGYFDPDEDARNGETDDHTGYHYVVFE